MPARGERFDVALRLIAPTTAATGLRGDREVARRIVQELVDMEQQYFDDR